MSAASKNNFVIRMKVRDDKGTQRYAHAPEELMRQAVQVFGRRTA